MPGQPLTQSSPTHSSLPSREGAAGRALLTRHFRLPSWNAEGGVGEGKGRRSQRTPLHPLLPDLAPLAPPWRTPPSSGGLGLAQESGTLSASPTSSLSLSALL